MPVAHRDVHLRAWATVEEGIAGGERIGWLKDVSVNFTCVAGGRAQNRTPDVCSSFKMSRFPRKNLVSRKGLGFQKPARRSHGAPGRRAGETQIRFKPGQGIESLPPNKTWVIHISLVCREMWVYRRAYG